MRFILPLMVTAFTFSAFAKKSQELLQQVKRETAPLSVSLKTWPQNMGGQSPKLMLDKADKLSNKITKLSLSDEAVFQNVMADVIHPLRQMMESQKLNWQALSIEGHSYGLAEVKSGKTEEFDGIKVSSWTPTPNQAQAEFAKEFSRYLSQFSKIEYVEVRPFSTSTKLSDRNPATSQPRAFNVSLTMDVRGLDKENKRRNDRWNVEATVAVKGKTWKFTGFEVQNGETLVSNESLFAEKNLFAEAPANYLRREAIRRGGYAISVADWNNDGIADLIVGHLKETEFFVGQKDHTFVKADAKSLGIENETLVKSAVVEDFDNDGHKDILLVRFAPNEEQGRDIVLYKGSGSKFQKVTNIKNRYPAYYAMPSAVADYNGDGMLDFYVGFPGAKDFTVLNKKANGFAGLKELHPQGLFYNVGNFDFKEVTKEKLPYTKRHNAYTDGYPEASVVFPHTSAGIDYDLDGDMDIVVVDDKANLSPLYKNDGKGSFTQIADKIGTVNSDFGMGFAAADLDNDGKLEFIYTNVNFSAAERLGNSMARNFSEFNKQPGTYGVRIFKTTDGKNYSDVTAVMGLSNAGEGVGGIEVVDYNNDGYPDIYVANGLWSGNSREQDLSSMFVRAYSKFDFDFQEVMGSSEGIEQANTSFMKILTGFQGDIEKAIPKKDVYPSMAGFQRNRLFRNNGNGTFTEIGYLAGVDSIADGYVVATADLNQDGKMDLVLRNGDPGTEVNRYPSVQTYINNFKGPSSVILSFQGTQSGRDAVGMIAEAKIGDKKLIRHLVANNGSVQSEAILHFGLGDAKKIDLLTLRWPSGNVETFENVLPGRHHFTEVEKFNSAGR